MTDLTAETFDAAFGPKQRDGTARCLKSAYLTGWKEHAHFTGYSVEFLKKLAQQHPDAPIGQLAGRPFSEKAALAAWLKRVAKAA